MSTRRGVRIAGWTAAGVLGVGAVGVGIAQADDPKPSPTASGTAGPRTHHKGHDRWDGKGQNAGEDGEGRHGRFGGRGLGELDGQPLHGEFVVKGKDGKPVTVDVQRGDVTAVSASSVTLRSEDGFTATYAIAKDTKVRINAKGSTAAQVKTGDKAMVTARKSGSTVTADLLTVRE